MSSSAVQPVVALLTDAVGGNPTQYMVETALAHHDLDWRYLTFEVTAEDLGDAVRGMRAMRFCGAHCGHPHKQAILPLLDRVTDIAGTAGVVNLLYREDNLLVGDNTEGKGALVSLRRVADVANRRVVLLGAGQMARAVGVELAAAKAAEIIVVNRTEERGCELVDLLTTRFPVSASSVPWSETYEVPAETELVINATSIGQEDPDAQLPIKLDSLQSGMLVADVTTNPPRTWLLREAGQRGCTTVDGLGMYIDQVAAGLELWTGVDPDRDVMREAIEEFLEV